MILGGKGHPSVPRKWAGKVMDMSFSDQSLSVEYLVKHGSELKPDVYKVPAEIDEQVAKLKLEALGISIDKLTKEQMKYLSDWKSGTE